MTCSKDLSLLLSYSKSITKPCSQPLPANTNSNLKKAKHSYYKQIYPAQTLLSQKQSNGKTSLPEDWILEGAAPPELPPPPQPNVQIKNITQYTDGKVKLSFHRHSTSSRFSAASSSSSTIDLGRISKIPSFINIPYCDNLPRKSTSDIPSPSFQNVDYTTNIPKPVYTNLEQPSPPTSPTFSAKILLVNAITINIMFSVNKF